jgi:predicted nucleotidyltransferase
MISNVSKASSRHAIRVNTPKGGCTILSVIGGSHSYGTNHEGSDVDLRSVYTLPVKDFTGVTDPVTHFELEDPYDISMKEVSKFVRLLANGNPHILETLWGPDDLVLSSSAGGKILRDNREQFITEKCVNSYTGYLSGQIGYAQRMGAEHPRYIKTKRHILRLILCTNHLIHTGTPLVRLNRDQIKFVMSYPDEVGELEFFTYAEKHLLVVQLADLTELFADSISTDFQNDIIQTIRNTQEATNHDSR